MGYVEKPLWLRSDVAKDNTLRRIEISVLSDYFSVSIQFFGTEEDQKRNKDSEFCFTVRNYCEAFLMFKMGEFRDCVPVRFMREGYRVIVGRNDNYCDCGVRVLIKIRVKITKDS